MYHLRFEIVLINDEHFFEISVIVEDRVASTFRFALRDYEHGRKILAAIEGA